MMGSSARSIRDRDRARPGIRHAQKRADRLLQFGGFAPSEADGVGTLAHRFLDVVLDHRAGWR